MKLSKHEQNEYLDSLYYFGKRTENGRICSKATSLYANLRKNLSGAGGRTFN
jgi:hypothetical protein